MSHRHHSRTEQSRDRKRAGFAKQTQQGNKRTATLVIALTALFAIAIYFVMSGMSDKPASTKVAVASSNPGQSVDGSANGEIRIPLSDVAGGKAKFFDYTASDNRSLRFFVIKSSDGVYRAALDACDVCFAGKKGYRQQGDDLVCNKCGNHFPSASVNEVSGGCNPVGLTRTIEGSELVIKAWELESRKSYF